MQALLEEDTNATHVAMTVHGIEIGLDVSEILYAQISGLIDAIRAGEAPKTLEAITFVERVASRYLRLDQCLGLLAQSEKLSETEFIQVNYGENSEVQDKYWVMTASIGGDDVKKEESEIESTSSKKSYAVAIIPDRPCMEDFFYYGIQRPVHSMGLLCERDSIPKECDTPLDLDRRIRRIEGASVVICDATCLTHELHLLIGFACGRGIPTVCLNPLLGAILCHIKSQITYETIRQLEDQLGKWLREQLENSHDQSEPHASIFRTDQKEFDYDVECTLEQERYIRK